MATALRGILLQRKKVSRTLVRGVPLIPLIVFFLFRNVFAAESSVCASVKIEIRQELTLERQAFDANMKINNGFPNLTLENINITVKFQDKDGNSVIASSNPDDTSALFFIRVSSMTGVTNSDINGSGIVAPSTTADIHWLIIPAIGAAKGLPEGALYYVGAVLSYRAGSEEKVVDVIPDYIFVKPMPELSLDYFFPYDVYGDDPFTAEIEPSVPFTLGVRAKNTGKGIARDVRIESAQPKIIENDQGLLVDFRIVESRINNQPSTNNLLVDFGDILPKTSSIGRWMMECSLSGRFTEFTAAYTHSDELGGKLTSVISALNTHTLVHDVLDDLPGRDAAKDFLAKDGSVYKLYESDAIDTEVNDWSASAALVFSSQTGSKVSYTLTVSQTTTGFMYAQAPDPYNGQKIIKEVTRSDGKNICLQNTWLSKTKNTDTGAWEYYFNLFDGNTTTAYIVVLDDYNLGLKPPVLQFIPDYTGTETQRLSFIVQASGPDGTTPIISALPLPAAAAFVDRKDGSGLFDWAPAIGQAGKYEITFKASDGALEDSQMVTITVQPEAVDSDHDGMPDAWEIQYFSSLSRDGTGDYNGNGISDFDEYKNGSDPVKGETPGVPVIISPLQGQEVLTLPLEISIQNSSNPDGSALKYEFEVYSDEQLLNLAASAVVNETENNTKWVVTAALQDNTLYYLRARATDDARFSQWAYGSFFVNTANENAGIFNVSYPSDGREVDTLTPRLEVNNSQDIDKDKLVYSFEVYTDNALAGRVASVTGITAGEGGRTSWRVNKELQDNTVYYWKSIVTDEHGAVTETNLFSFTVNTANHAPEAPQILAPASQAEVAVVDIELSANNSGDFDNDALRYHFEIDKTDTFNSSAKRISGALPEGKWMVSGLEEHTEYFWRVKADDGKAESLWVYGNFFVNTVNSAASVPKIKNPAQKAWVVDTLTPILEAVPSVDIDRDSIKYEFELYLDSAFTQRIAGGISEYPSWVVPAGLINRSWYYWRARGIDEHSLAGDWMPQASFFVKDNEIDDSADIRLLEPAGDIFINNGNVYIKWQDEDIDSNAQISLYYNTQNSGEGGVLIASGINEDPDGQADMYSWDISSIPEGVYYIYAVISDAVNKVVDYAQGAVNIDRTGPLVTIAPKSGIYNSTQTVSFTANEGVTIYYTLDESRPSVDSIIYTQPIAIMRAAVLKYTAFDKAGNNTSCSEKYTVLSSLDFDLHLTNNPDWSRQNALSWSWQKPEALPEIAGYTYSVDSGERVFTAGQAFTCAFLPDGKHTFSVNMALNNNPLLYSNANTDHFGIDTTPPQLFSVELNKGNAVTESRQVPISVNHDNDSMGNGSGIARTEISIDSSAFSVLDAATVVLPDVPGKHTVAVRVVDNVGLLSETKSDDVYLLNAAELANLIPKATEALKAGDYETAGVYARYCICLSRNKALLQQASLIRLPLSGQEVSYKELNDTGAAYYILALCAQAQGSLENAVINCLEVIHNYAYSKFVDIDGTNKMATAACRGILPQLGTGIDFSDSSSNGLAQKASAALNNGQNINAVIYAEKCVELYEDNAKRKQAGLSGFPAARQIKNYESLNNVGGCLFVEASALKNMNYPEISISISFVAVEKFSYSQHKNSRGIYVSVVKSLREMLPGLKTGIDFDDGSPGTLTLKAREALNGQDFIGALIYADRCVQLYEAQAKAQQMSLDNFPPLGEIGNYEALNSVGACYFIKAAAFQSEGYIEPGVYALLHAVREFSYSQRLDEQGRVVHIISECLHTLIQNGDSINFGDSRSTVLISLAKEAVSSNNMINTLAYIEKCIELYKKEALAQQAGLTRYPPKNKVDNYRQLNDAALGYYILGNAYSQRNDWEKAVKSYQVCVNELFYAQASDDRGNLWSISSAAKRRISEILKVR